MTELEKLNRLLRSSGRMDKNTSMRSFFQALDEGATLGDNDILGVPRVMTNKTRMDALQIVKEDKKLGTGFVNLAEEKAILQRQAESSSKIAEEARNELTTLSNASKDAKRAFFETDLRLNRDKILLADFKKAKEQIIKDYGSVDMFFQEFFDITKSIQGSGWGVLVWSPDLGRLVMLPVQVLNLN